MRISSERSIKYCNPVLGAYLADPFVLLHDGRYYAVGTCRVDNGAFPMYISDDLVQWEPAGPCLAPLDPVLGTDFWAPEIAVCDDRFYMYYSVGFRDQGHRLRVAAADTPSGPYVDLGMDLVDPAQCSFAIDPSPFRDADGDWYLFYARDFLDSSCAKPGTGLVVDRMLSMTSLAGEEQVVARPSKDWQRFMAERPIYGGVYDWHTLEGPCPVLHDGQYFCFFSGGRWENETYGVDYVSAPSPLGPWISDWRDSPRVLQSVPGHVIGPGHNSVVLAPDGETEYLVYHAWDPAMTSRRMCIDKLEWVDGRPSCEGPTWIAR